MKSNILAGKKGEIPSRAAPSILQQGTDEIKHKHGGVIYQIISCFEIVKSTNSDTVFLHPNNANRYSYMRCVLYLSPCICVEELGLQYLFALNCKKKVSDFPVPSQDVTNQIFPGRKYFFLLLILTLLVDVLLLLKSLESLLLIVSILVDFFFWHPAFTIVSPVLLPTLLLLAFLLLP